MIISRDLFFRGERLSTDEFGMLFDEHWDKMSRRFFKYEGLQAYDEGPESAILSYVSGNLGEFAEHLKSAREEDKPFFESAKRRGTEFFRVHAVCQPLSTYMEAEFYSYVLSERLGERIHYVFEETVRSEIGFFPPDHILFDDTFALVHDYDVNGRLVGGWGVSGKDSLVAISEISSKLLEMGTPFRQLYQGRPEILELFN